MNTKLIGLLAVLMLSSTTISVMAINNAIIDAAKKQAFCELAQERTAQPGVFSKLSSSLGDWGATIKERYNTSSKNGLIFKGVTTLNAHPHLVTGGLALASLVSLWNCIRSWRLVKSAQNYLTRHPVTQPHA